MISATVESPTTEEQLLANGNAPTEELADASATREISSLSVLRILMAIDGSAQAQAALQLGAQLTAAGQAAVRPTILTVAASRSGRAKGETILAEALAAWPSDLPAPQGSVGVGRIAEAVAQAATTGKHDLVMIGDGGANRLMSLFLGSTVLDVVERVPCSVIVARGAGRPLRRILLCDSGAHSPSLSHHFLRQLKPVLAPDTAVTVLHVMSQIAAGPSIDNDQLYADAETLIREHAVEGEWLLQDLRMLERLPLQTQAKVRHGFVVDEILDEACSGDYDLVVIGAHTQEGWLDLLLDDLAGQIIAQCDRSVMLVRP